MNGKALQIHANDNIAVALTEINRGGVVEALGPKSRALVTALQPIPFAHKIAIDPIPCGAAIMKYGVTIAVATTEINSGDWVHVHNAVSPLSQTKHETAR